MVGGNGLDLPPYQKHFEKNACILHHDSFETGPNCNMYVAVNWESSVVPPDRQSINPFNVALKGFWQTLLHSPHKPKRKDLCHSWGVSFTGKELLTTPIRDLGEDMGHTSPSPTHTHKRFFGITS
jgi:hypothetical protein